MLISQDKRLVECYLSLQKRKELIDKKTGMKKEEPSKC
jgi:hypothetical protein